MIWKFKNLWDGTQWLYSVIVETNKKGMIQSLKSLPSSPQPAEVDEEVKGWAIPGLPNAHSHAFQFAMAGLTEYQGHQDSEDFWSWRQQMYQFAKSLTPQQMECVATALYATMLKRGYTWVAEFHYFHHDKNGRPYGHLSEMGQALLHAAHKTGIGITLIPIFYNQGGFNKAPSEGQKRFISKNIEDYLKLHAATATQCHGPRQKLGLGIHSLRAIKPEHIQPLVEQAPSNLPWHIHISEQKREVLECLEVLGQRPIQWLLSHAPVDENWHLVHATHMDPMEIKTLQTQKAHVILCPSTEANLGDGIFPLVEFWRKGGHWSIGSDSHIHINPLEELRWLDYIQRLQYTKRNVLCHHKNDNSGELLFQEAFRSGHKAMETFPPKLGLAVGQPLDLIIVKPQATLWEDTAPTHLLSTLIYSTSPSDFAGVVTNGRWVVKEGQHTLEDSILKDWTKHVSSLRGSVLSK